MMPVTIGLLLTIFPNSPFGKSAGFRSRRRQVRILLGEPFVCVAQLEEHRPDKTGVASSSLAVDTRPRFRGASYVTQMAGLTQNLQSRDNVSCRDRFWIGQAGDSRPLIGLICLRSSVG